MRLSSTTALVAIGSLTSLPAAYAWGAAGHEIVATIAQMYLHPNVLPTLCDILELPTGRCHLASVATWADQHRMQMRWSASLHYIGALDDHPSRECAFPGSNGWAGTQHVNVLDGIKNTTSLLQDWVNHDASDATASEALKFLIHFMGDMHQPLHLTGRDRGGNSVKVLFGRRHTNLHSLWDGFLIAKAVRVVPPNYSHPLPYPKIEESLQGTIYDSYIRRILWEGVLNPWEDQLDTWLECPSVSPLESEAEALSSSGLTGIWRTAYAFSNQLVQMITPPKRGVEIGPDGPVVCPYFWAQPAHKLNCDIIWPKELDFKPRSGIASERGYHHDHDHQHDEEYEFEFAEGEVNSNSDSSVLSAPRPRILQLDTPEYAGVIEREMIIERLLTQGGIRLAGVLNYIFAGDAQPDPNVKKAFLQHFRA